MRRRTSHALSLCLALIAVLSGCKPAPVSPKLPSSKPPEAPTLMSPQARAAVSRLAEAPPPFKLFLQRLDMPTILVVAEDTTDDQLKSLLWFLRIQVRSARFRSLGLQPTASVFDRPGYTSGVLNIYRGARCAREMYITAGPDPCGPSIHKSASYHWGDGGDPQADGADLVSATGASTEVFAATDGWQTEEQARIDPSGTRHQASVARIHYALAQTAKQTKQRTDLRFFPGQPDTELSVISYQLAAEPGQKRFLNEFLTLEHDHFCSLGFQSIRLGVRGSSGKPYPVLCTPLR